MEELAQIKFAFEPGWRFIDLDGDKFIILNKNYEVVAQCVLSTNAIVYCKDITDYEKAIADGVAKINCGLNISLSNAIR